MTRSSCRSRAFTAFGVLAVVAVVTACGSGSTPAPGMSGTALPAAEQTPPTTAPTVPADPVLDDDDRTALPTPDPTVAPVADDPPAVDDPPVVDDSSAVDDRFDIVDDHSDTAVGATPVAVGEEAAGSVDYEFDEDFFTFEAEAGGLYRIEVLLGTLEDSVAVLYGADEWELAYNDDYLDLESRIYWQAESSGAFYVAVRGYEDKMGSYTLTVASVVDDHADSADGATPVAVGESAAGSVDYAYDVDYFAFEAQAGEFYRIDVKLGTLSDSVAALYDAEGSELAYNDDRDGSDDHDYMDLSSRFDWQAQSSGTFYVAVTGYEAVTGSYTLTVDGFASTASLS